MKTTRTWAVAVVLSCGSGLAVAATSSDACHGPVEAEVCSAMRSSDDGTAFVLVMLQPVSVQGMGEQRRIAVAEMQDRVLSRLAPGAFAVAYRYRNFPALAGRISASGLATLAASREVVAVGLDAWGTGRLDTSGPFIGADQVHDLGITGQGVTVAVLDSGIDTDHPDLVDNIAAGAWHFLSQGALQGPGAEDGNGHGTNVSGIITSAGTVAPPGIAPDADILAVKVLDAGGGGWLSDWAAGVDYIVSVHGNYDNLCAINASLGSYAVHGVCPCDNTDSYNRMLGAAFQAAKDSGISTFASSANSGYCGLMSSPACLSAAVAVAAVYDLDLGREPDWGTYRDSYGNSFGACYDAVADPDRIACFSSRSTCNELAAPGRRITSTGRGGGTSTYTGTSQAAPHCAGVAALMAACAGASAPTPNEVVQVMKDTGVQTIDPCTAVPSPVRVDALAAVRRITVRGDANRDGVVDRQDIDGFIGCLTGPDGGPVDPACWFADFHDDGDADLEDIAGFQLAFSSGD